MNIKQHLEEYTEAEFVQLVGEFFENRSGLKGQAFGEYQDHLADEFERLTEHPAKSDLIYYPEEGHAVTPQSIVRHVIEWRAANNKPGFKPA
ncbi:MULTISPECIES: bacteriocin immunity protein [unclassified Pseudomonas]|uniref:bacteriocin immunity protein n=1 Tax=unclassified Pseudomonas TaxID=196821 RepID=UPI0021C71CCD|nr:MULTISPECIES: bacteriocin immunity protein [unclassified Pseudomonas]MCU1735351.1 bacteriocin immunity protein [Pseudomonas sp. 20P_3.2_Bac4]MCU1747810.1 bacteriocin immunity protein [Pseudomonas sp. 20P_3.2_Bac5]